MGWLYNWTVQRTDPRGSYRYRAASKYFHDDLSSLELRNDKGKSRGNGGSRNRINGGRRGDNGAEDQGGDKDKGGNNNNNNNNNGDGDNNKNNDDKGDGDKNKPSDHSSSTKPPSSFTTTITSVEPPTTVVIPSATLTSSVIITTTEVSTMSTISTQTEGGGGSTPTSFTISPTNSVPASSSSSVVPSSSSSVTATTVIPSPPSTSSSQGSTPAISSSELSAGAKAGIAIAALSAFALLLGGIYLCWRRGASRTRATAGMQPATPGVQGSLVQGAVGMAQARRRSLDNHQGDPGPVHSASWRTTHPWRPPSAQSNTEAAAADLLVPPAPPFQRSAQDARRTMATWDTSSEPDSSAADRFSASALATYLSPAPTRPRRIPGSADV